MAKIGKIKYVSITYTNGVTLKTDVNPNLTDAQVKNYFKIGAIVNIGSGEKDRLTKIKRVAIHR